MRVSRQIGWSDKSNILYNILQELEAISCKIACSGTTTTTTSTTTEAPPCYVYGIFNGNPDEANTFNYVDCNGDNVNNVVIAKYETLVICAREVSVTEPVEAANTGAICNPTCKLYSITPTSEENDYTYTDCNGNSGGGTSLTETLYICATTGTVTGTNVTIALVSNICECIQYNVTNNSGAPQNFTYVGCDGLDKSDSVGTGVSNVKTVCSLTVPDVPLDVFAAPGSICIL